MHTTDKKAYPNFASKTFANRTFANGENPLYFRQYTFRTFANVTRRLIESNKMGSMNFGVPNFCGGFQLWLKEFLCTLDTALGLTQRRMCVLTMLFGK